MSKRINTRIVQKHDIEANWLKATSFVPLQGELILYDVEVDKDGNTLELPVGRTTPYRHERLKLGDGITTVTNLPFADELLLDTLLDTLPDTLSLDSTKISHNDALLADVLSSQAEELSGLGESVLEISKKLENDSTGGDGSIADLEVIPVVAQEEIRKDDIIYAYKYEKDTVSSLEQRETSSNSHVTEYGHHVNFVITDEEYGWWDGDEYYPDYTSYGIDLVINLESTISIISTDDSNKRFYSREDAQAFINNSNYEGIVSFGVSPNGDYAWVVFNDRVEVYKVSSHSLVGTINEYYAYTVEASVDNKYLLISGDYPTIYNLTSNSLVFSAYDAINALSLSVEPYQVSLKFANNSNQVYVASSEFNNTVYLVDITSKSLVSTLDAYSVEVAYGSSFNKLVRKNSIDYTYDYYVGDSVVTITADQTGYQENPILSYTGDILIFKQNGIFKAFKYINAELVCLGEIVEYTASSSQKLSISRDNQYIYCSDPSTSIIYSYYIDCEHNHNRLVPQLPLQIDDIFVVGSVGVISTGEVIVTGNNYTYVYSIIEHSINEYRAYLTNTSLGPSYYTGKAKTNISAYTEGELIIMDYPQLPTVISGSYVGDGTGTIDVLVSVTHDTAGTMYSTLSFSTKSVNNMRNIILPTNFKPSCVIIGVCSEDGTGNSILLNNDGSSMSGIYINVEVDTNDNGKSHSFGDTDPIRFAIPTAKLENNILYVASDYSFTGTVHSNEYGEFDESKCTVDYRGMYYDSDDEFSYDRLSFNEAGVKYYYLAW